MPGTGDPVSERTRVDAARCNHSSEHHRREYLLRAAKFRSKRFIGKIRLPVSWRALPENMM